MAGAAQQLRERRSETRAGKVELRIPKLCKGSYFPSFPEPSIPQIGSIAVDRAAEEGFHPRLRGGRLLS